MNLTVQISKYEVKHFEDRRDRRFLPVELWIVSEGLNINKSIFTPESLINAKDKFRNLSLSAKYEQFTNDFKGHEVIYKCVDTEGWSEFEYIEVPIGVIPEASNIRIEIDEDGKQWIVADGLIWSERNRKVEKLLKKNSVNNISMEIAVLDYEDQDGVQVIKEFLPLSVVFISNKKKTGIANARSIVREDQIRMFSDSLVLAFEANELGAGDPIKIDLKKSSISNDAWGDVDKTKLRNDILNAENYESLVEKCYLVVNQGWQDAPSEELGYPVCQIKNGKLVYNRNAIITARRFLEANKGEDYYNSVNSKLVKIEKKIGLWKEYDYAKFEGGGSLNKEKLDAVFQAMFGADLIGYSDNFVAYVKRGEEGISFACKKYALEIVVKEEDDEEEPTENVLVSEEEFEATPKFVAYEKNMVDEQEVVTEQFVCGGDKVKEFVATNDAFASEKQTMTEQYGKNIAEFEAQIDSLNKSFEAIQTEKETVVALNKAYEAEKLATKLHAVVNKYEDALGVEGVDSWKEKSKQYEAEDSLEKDILYALFSEKPNNEHFRYPAHNVKPVEKANGNFWDILENNVK